MKVKILTRVVTYDEKSKKVLLVKNKGMDFWYPPGGGWEYEKENILECAKREVYEETGFHVDIKRMLYLQEFHANPELITFETIWLAEPSHEQILNENHIDLDPNGMVEMAQWYSREELQGIKVFPLRMKNTFWSKIKTAFAEEDPFLGVN